MFLETFVQYPPRWKAPSFSVEQIAVDVQARIAHLKEMTPAGEQ